MKRVHFTAMTRVILFILLLHCSLFSFASRLESQLAPQETGNKPFSVSSIATGSDPQAYLQEIIVSMGDSITICYGVSHYGNCYVPRLSSLIGIPAYNEGVDRAVSLDGRYRIDDILSYYQPQFLTIYYGTNDAGNGEYTPDVVINNLGYMVDRCLNKGTKPIIATLGPQFGDHYQFKSKIDDINQRIRQLAARKNIPLADISSALNWNQSYMWDDMHPNSAGHEIIARTFYQAMIGCTYSISPTSDWVSGSSGNGSVSVSVTASEGVCSWTAVSNVSWITITSGSSGTWNGTVNYSYTANNTGSTRTGAVTVEGQTFTVTQKKMAGLPWLQLLLGD